MIRLRNLRSGDLVQLDWKVGSGDLILPDLEALGFLSHGNRLEVRGGVGGSAL